LLIKSDPKLLNKTLTLEYEMNYGAQSEIDFLSQNRQYDLHRHRLNIQGNILDIEYGAKINSFDNTYGRMLLVGKSKDMPGKELWLKKDLGFASLKTYISDYIDTVNFDEVRPRTRKNQIGSALEFKFNNLPIISFAYSKGIHTKTQKNEVLETTKNSVHNLNIYSYYWKPKWDVSIDSNMYMADEKNQYGTKGNIKSIELSGTYRVIDSISINNTMGIVHEDYDWSEGGISYMTQYTSLSFSYYPTNSPISISFYGYYSNYEGSDTYTDSDSFNGLAATTLSLGKNFLGDQSLSFEVGYLGYMDNAFSTNNYNIPTSYIKYQVTTF